MRGTVPLCRRVNRTKDPKGRSSTVSIVAATFQAGFPRRCATPEKTSAEALIMRPAGVYDHGLNGFPKIDFALAADQRAGVNARYAAS